MKYLPFPVEEQIRGDSSEVEESFTGKPRSPKVGFQSRVSQTERNIIKHAKIDEVVRQKSFAKRGWYLKTDKKKFESFKEMPMVNKQQNTLNFNNLNILVEGSRSRQNSKGTSFRNFGMTPKESVKGTPSFFRSFECTHRFVPNGVAPPFHSLDITMNNSVNKKEFKIERESLRRERSSQNSPVTIVQRLAKAKKKATGSTRAKKKRRVSTAKASDDSKTNYVLFWKKNQMIGFEEVLKRVMRRLTSRKQGAERGCAQKHETSRVPGADSGPAGRPAPAGEE